MLSHTVVLKPCFWGVHLEDFYYLSLTRVCRQRWISGSSEALADTPLGLVLIKAGLGVQSGSFCTHPEPAEGTTCCGSLIAPNSCPRASQSRVWLRATPESCRPTYYTEMTKRSSQQVKTKRQAPNERMRILQKNKMKWRQTIYQIESLE